jgi:hypothetical protein
MATAQLYGKVPTHHPLSTPPSLVTACTCALCVMVWLVMLRYDMLWYTLLEYIMVLCLLVCSLVRLRVCSGIQAGANPHCLCSRPRRVFQNSTSVFLFEGGLCFSCVFSPVAFFRPARTSAAPTLAGRLRCALGDPLAPITGPPLHPSRPPAGRAPAGHLGQDARPTYVAYTTTTICIHQYMFTASDKKKTGIPCSN